MSERDEASSEKPEFDPATGLTWQRQPDRDGFWWMDNPADDPPMTLVEVVMGRCQIMGNEWTWSPGEAGPTDSRYAWAGIVAPASRRRAAQ